MTTYSPLRVFQAFLSEMVKRDTQVFNGNMIELHKAFYAAREEFPEVMDAYVFRKTTNPYSQTLQETMIHHDLAGITVHQLDDTISIKKPEILPEPDSKLKQVAEFIAEQL